MYDNLKLTLPVVFEESLKKHAEEEALSFVGETPITYRELNSKVNSMIKMLQDLGVKKGDRVAILSTNIPNWGIAYYAITFYGAIAVPILPDFSEQEISNVLEHAEVSVIFVSEGLKKKLVTDSSTLKNVINIEDFSCKCKEDVSYEEGSVPAEFEEPEEEDLLSIIYTSGTTGKSKGVMLTHKNVVYDAIKGRDEQPVNTGDRFLSVLPLSHTYENTLGLILPMLGGACVYYIKKLPSPSILMQAMQKVKPTIMLTVPLIIEKIYYNRIIPTFSKGAMKFFYGIPPFRKLLNRLAGKKLMKTFGGEVHFFGIGGAKLNPTVEKFLIEAKFPYAIGYGLTETSPYLAGVGPKRTRFEGVGPVIDGCEMIIHDPDPVTGEGEIWARGPIVMKGYYKEPELTKQVLTEDGWFKTGDLAVIKDDYVYIKGRLKNMILGASGENIYPEEIESVINTFSHVVESIVVEKKGKLVALVHFNIEELEEKYKHLREEVHNFVEHAMDEISAELHAYVNSKVNKFSRIHVVVPHLDPFQKTATQKIKRFLYA